MPRGRALSAPGKQAGARGARATPDASARPELSVVVVIASDTTRPRADCEALGRFLEAMEGQQDAPAVEVVVPVHDAVDGVPALEARFPKVRFLRVDGPKGPSLTGERVHHHTLRTRGLLAARGAFVALAEDHARPDARWCANLVAAHRALPHAAIGGPIDNEIDTPLCWAVYFCDFARYQSPLPEGPTDSLSDINVAYKRGALEAIRPVWAGGFFEVVVNDALRARGEALWARPDVVMRQHRRGLRLRDALGERFAWGRSYAQVRSATLSRARRLSLAFLSPALPVLLGGRILAVAARRGRLGRALVALPAILLLECAWSLGEYAGYRAEPVPD